MRVTYIFITGILITLGLLIASVIQGPIGYRYTGKAVLDETGYTDFKSLVAESSVMVNNIYTVNDDYPVVVVYDIVIGSDIHNSPSITGIVDNIKAAGTSDIETVRDSTLADWALITLLISAVVTLGLLWVNTIDIV
jgi:hypothetical protein